MIEFRLPLPEMSERMKAAAIKYGYLFPVDGYETEATQEAKMPAKLSRKPNADEQAGDLAGDNDYE